MCIRDREQADYCLMDIIMKQKEKLPLNIITNGFIDIANALCYLQNIGICHRDIKPQNILVKGTQFKLADFGTTKQVLSASVQQATIIGTFEYWSPELFQLKFKDSNNFQLDCQQLQPEEQSASYQHQINLFKNDVFSLGLTILSLLLQRQVVDPKQWNQDNTILQERLMEIEKQYPKFHKILKQMLALSPEQRVDFNGLQKLVNETLI
eukprot:TRINITY_DN26877_c0_g1_i2.p1 TRINITY_DN26877_c0_g1~~TRINITY_DN26877_c0_g1_i2.p1  ORF type:complete len:209 (-),score=25.54 TRINITY_DN26877_c0_g1_i2:133-759(-)